jgi:hypothetical protein
MLKRREVRAEGYLAFDNVQRERYVAKFWLEPVGLVTNRGFRAYEIRRITRLVVQHHATLLEAWHDYFGT